MIDPKKVSAVLVTKGGRDVASIRERLSVFGQVIVWNNAAGIDEKVFGRYLGVLQATCDHVYVQDDDCLIDVERLCAEYRPDEVLCNVLPSHAPFYGARRMSLVGWGSIFPKTAVNFDPYLWKFASDELFKRECDRVFTRLNWLRIRVVDIGVEHLPWAHGDDRMGREARHGNDLEVITQRLAVL